MVVFEWESSSYNAHRPHFAGVSRRAWFLLSPLFSLFHIGIRRFPAARNTCSKRTTVHGPRITLPSFPVPTRPSGARSPLSADGGGGRWARAARQMISVACARGTFPLFQLRGTDGLMQAAHTVLLRSAPQRFLRLSEVTARLDYTARPAARYRVVGNTTSPGTAGLRGSSSGPGLLACRASTSPAGFRTDRNRTVRQ